MKKIVLADTSFKNTASNFPSLLSGIVSYPSITAFSDNGSVYNTVNDPITHKRKSY